MSETKVLGSKTSRVLRGGAFKNFQKLFFVLLIVLALVAANRFLTPASNAAGGAVISNAEVSLPVAGKADLLKTPSELSFTSISDCQNQPCMIFFYDGDVGLLGNDWECISCNRGDPFYNLFPRGGTSINNVHGTDLSLGHTHTFSVSMSGPSATNPCESGYLANTASGAHTHASLSGTFSSAGDNPPYRKLKLIMYKPGIPTTTPLPAGVIAMFESIPDGWTAYSQQNNGFFVMGGSDAGSTGGSETHSHTLDASFSRDVVGVVSTSGSGLGRASDSHLHDTDYVRATTLPSSNLPLYTNVTFAKLSSSGDIPIGMFAMFTDYPTNPNAWVPRSTYDGAPFYNRFLRGSDTYLPLAGGSDSHTHDEVRATTPASSSTVSHCGSNGNTNVSDSIHTHVVKWTNIGYYTNIPLYREVIISQYAGGLASNGSYLDANKTASPSRVYQGQNVTLTINLTGAGDPRSYRNLLDVMLSFDVSESMDDYLADLRNAGYTFVNASNPSYDRVGLVSFGGTAILNRQLTSNQAEVNNSIASLISTRPGTNIGDGILYSLNHILQSTRPQRLPFIILFTDGKPNCPQAQGSTSCDIGNETYATAYALSASLTAAAARVPIYVIGFSASVNQTLLRQIANNTGGRYYNTTNAAQLAAIFANISIELNNVVATNAQIVDAIPTNMQFNGPVPSDCSYNAVGKTLKCSHPLIILNESWVVQFNVSTNSLGVFPTNTYCNYSYVNASNYTKMGSLVSPNVTVVSPPNVTLTAVPSFGYGEFSSDLIASVYELDPTMDYVAVFFCTNDTATNYYVRYISPSIIQQYSNGSTFASVDAVCVYPEPSQPTDYNASVHVYKIINNEWYDFDPPLKAWAWVNSYPGDLALRDWTPVDNSLVPAAVDFNVSCYALDISSGASLSDCACKAYYRLTNSIVSWNEVTLNLTTGGGLNHPPYYSGRVQLVANKVYNHYFYCSRYSRTAVTPVMSFKTSTGSAQITLDAVPNVGVGLFPSRLNASVTDIPVAFHSSPVMFDCDNGQTASVVILTWNGNNGYAETTCFYPQVGSPTPFTATASMNLNQGGFQLKDQKTIYDNPNGDYLTMGNYNPWNQQEVATPFNFSLTCVVHYANTTQQCTSCNLAGHTPTLSLASGGIIFADIQPGSSFTFGSNSVRVSDPRVDVTADFSDPDKEWVTDGSVKPFYQFMFRISTDGLTYHDYDVPPEFIEGPNVEGGVSGGGIVIKGIEEAPESKSLSFEDGVMRVAVTKVPDALSKLGFDLKELAKNENAQLELVFYAKYKENVLDSFVTEDVLPYFGGGQPTIVPTPTPPYNSPPCNCKAYYAKAVEFSPGISPQTWYSIPLPRTTGNVYKAPAPTAPPLDLGNYSVHYNCSYGQYAYHDSSMSSFQVVRDAPNVEIYAYPPEGYIFQSNITATFSGMSSPPTEVKMSCGEKWPEVTILPPGYVNTLPCSYGPEDGEVMYHPSVFGIAPNGKKLSANTTVTLHKLVENCNPPASSATNANWTIPFGAMQYCRDRTIPMPSDGNVNIAGILIFSNVTLQMMPTVDGSSKIFVDTTGTFTVKNLNPSVPQHSVIQSGSCVGGCQAPAYLFQVYGKIDFENNDVSSVGYDAAPSGQARGIYLQGANAVFTNNTISNTPNGLILQGVNNAQIEGNTITVKRPAGAANPAHALYLTDSSTNNQIKLNKFIYPDDQSLGVAFDSSSQNKLTSNVFDETSGNNKAVYGEHYSLSNIVLDSGIPQNVHDKAHIVTDAESTVTREWYHNVHVKYRDDVDVPNAAVEIMPAQSYSNPAPIPPSGAPIFHGTNFTANTNATGFTPVNETIQYDQKTNVDNEVLYNKYNVTACVNRPDGRICSSLLTDITSSTTTEITIDALHNYGCEITLDPQNLYPPVLTNTMSVTFDPNGNYAGKEGTYTCARGVGNWLQFRVPSNLIFEAPCQYPGEVGSYTADVEIPLQVGQFPASCTAETRVGPEPTYFPSEVSFLSAVCPTSLVLGNTTNVTGYLVVKGEPKCLGLDSDNGWTFTITNPDPQATPTVLTTPDSCDYVGYNVFKVDTPIQGTYKVDLTAHTGAAPGVGDLSSSCTFNVLPNPPSRFPDLPLVLVVLAALGIFVYLARYNKKKKQAR